MLVTDKEHWKAARARLQEVIGRTRVVDGIRNEEIWRDGFVEDLRKLSLEETKAVGGVAPVVDKGSYKLRLDEWVHARVLFMILDLAAWMGPEWETHFPGSKEDAFIDLVRQAFRSCL